MQTAEESTDVTPNTAPRVTRQHDEDDDDGDDFSCVVDMRDSRLRDLEEQGVAEYRSAVEERQDLEGFLEDFDAQRSRDRRGTQDTPPDVKSCSKRARQDRDSVSSGNTRRSIISELHEGQSSMGTSSTHEDISSQDVSFRCYKTIQELSSADFEHLRHIIISTIGKDELRQSLVKLMPDSNMLDLQRKINKLQSESDQLRSSFDHEDKRKEQHCLQVC